MRIAMRIGAIMAKFQKKLFTMKSTVCTSISCSTCRINRKTENIVRTFDDTAASRIGNIWKYIDNVYRRLKSEVVYVNGERVVDFPHCWRQSWVLQGKVIDQTASVITLRLKISQQIFCERFEALLNAENEKNILIYDERRHFSAEWIEEERHDVNSVSLVWLKKEKARNGCKHASYCA